MTTYLYIKTYKSFTRVKTERAIYHFIIAIYHWMARQKENLLLGIISRMTEDALPPILSYIKSAYNHEHKWLL